MAKNDVVVRTAADLERKYNLGSLGGLKKNVEITAQGIQKIENELNSMLNALMINLKDVLDSQSEISLWFYSGKPTLSNEPCSLWNKPTEHIGDIYYDISSGFVYQYKEYDGEAVWEINADPNLVEAMAITNAETDTTTDHERKVFFDTPTIPYSNGDWWIKDDGSLYICQISKTSGTYEESDFINSSEYTESIATKINNEITVLKGTVTMISENFAKFTDLATGGSTTISGDNITTGNIQSQNYIQNTSGTKIFLEDGVIDAKNFKVDANGNVTCNNATINGSAILNGSKFFVDAEGNMTCSNATFTNGNIDTPNFKVDASGSVTMTDNPKSQTEANLYIISDKGKTYQSETFYQSRGIFSYEGPEREAGAYLAVGGGITPQVGAFKDYPDSSEYYTAALDPEMIIIQKSGKEISQTVIRPSGIETPTVTQTSLESEKKNFEKFENGLDVINNVDIYKYHLKGQEDTDKKHIGFVIGDNYNYREEITSQNNNGVDLYSMIAVTYKAIQEQQAEIQELRNEISKLKEG